MTLTNIQLILVREIRDQLRDRRTLFMIAVLPLVLYPLLGMTVLQISQFRQEQPTTVWIVGARSLEGLPPLLEGGQFAVRLFSQPEKARLLELHFAADTAAERSPTAAPSREGGHATAPSGEDPQLAEARRMVEGRRFDAALCFPADFAKRLESFRRVIGERAQHKAHADGRPANGTAEDLEVPSPEIIYSTANEKSLITYTRLSDVLRRWTQAIAEDNLAASGMPAEAAQPFSLDTADVAGQSGLRGAATWAKILPVLLVLWAMTGAFYPAVDLCAGEKERGTLETLLSSPASRSEIVLGKLLTIMLFSMLTAVLNLLSMGITGWAVMPQLPGIGPPPAMAIVWLSLALLPVSALFSALCLALAAFARSTKEGQYYLMPLILITMPLVLLSMSPGAELNLGDSLIPVTGLVLLLRNLLEGNYWHAVQYLPSVVLVTLASCVLAIRWAVDQFNSESVLFREGERLDMGLWVRHLLCEREPTPTVAAAVFCGVLILVVKFFMTFTLQMTGGFAGFARMALVTQLVVVATPSLLMTILFTSSPRQTLLLRRPPWLSLPAAALLAVLLHPAANALQIAVTQLYPVREDVKAALESAQAMLAGAPFWGLVVVLAVVPAFCEELAFRGFILSGFRHLGYKWRAIILSAMFFGLTHGILQQSLIACLIGLVIGYVAIQSGSIVPAMVFHMLHNTLAVALTKATPGALERWPVLDMLMSPAADGGQVYHWPIVVAGTVVAALVLVWFARLPYAKSSEEQLQEAIHRAA